MSLSPDYWYHPCVLYVLARVVTGRNRPHSKSIIPYWFAVQIPSLVWDLKRDVPCQSPICSLAFFSWNGFAKVFWSRWAYWTTPPDSMLLQSDISPTSHQPHASKTYLIWYDCGRYCWSRRVWSRGLLRLLGWQTRPAHLFWSTQRNLLCIIVHLSSGTRQLREFRYDRQGWTQHIRPIVCLGIWWLHFFLVYSSQLAY